MPLKVSKRHTLKNILQNRPLNKYFLTYLIPLCSFDENVDALDFEEIKFTKLKKISMQINDKFYLFHESNFYITLCMSDTYTNH